MYIDEMAETAGAEHGKKSDQYMVNIEQDNFICSSLTLQTRYQRKVARTGIW